MIKKRYQPSLRLIQQLEDAKIGDPGRLKTIKSSLETGKQIPEADSLYIQELAIQLPRAIEQQMMDDWGRDYAQKLQEREIEKTESKQEKPEPKQEKTIKLDEISVKVTAPKLKSTIEHDKKVKGLLDLIAQLKEAKIGDSNRLDNIAILLEGKKNIEESDKLYLKEKVGYLRLLTDFKKKVTWTIEAMRKLQEVEMRHSKKLEDIIHTVESGNPVSEREIRYLNARYEKLQPIIARERKIDWTMSTIEKFERFKVGESEKIKSIKELIEDDLVVPESEIRYLKEVYKLLKKVTQNWNKVEEVMKLINELQEMEIGNPERLDLIKQLLEQRKSLPESDLSYLAHKCRVYLILKKLDREQGENYINEEFVNHKSLLNEMNSSMQEIEKQKVSV